MTQSQEKLRRDGRTDRRTEGRTDRTYFIGPFRGCNNEKCISLILNFCPDFFGHVGKWLDKKYNVNFNLTSSTGKQL